MVKGISRRGVLPGAVALGTIVRAGRTAASGPTDSATALRDQAIKPLGRYVGTPTSRVDGRAKVTGAATYAGEFNSPGLTHGYVVSSTIAKGRILRIDTSEALRVQGVIDVFTHEHRPRMADTDSAYKDDVAPGGSPFRPLYDGRIMFNRQPIALVVAEDWETACFAASLVRVEYEKEAHVTSLHDQRDQAFALPAPASPRGDAGKAFAAADVRHAGEYSVPIEHHNPMEPFASTVTWDGGGKLTVYDKTQGVQNVQRYLRGIFDLKPDELRVVSLFVGGAFGLGLRPQYQVVLAVLAARALQRSVRVVLTRQQMYSLGYRPGMIQRIELGAKADGTLDTIAHDATTVTSQYEDFHRHETIWSGLLYKSANARYGHKLARLDLATSCDMRGPSASTGVYALESAMDELAVALKLDPLELRLRCYSDRDQNNGNLPFSSKNLRECYRQGALAFGWDKRSRQPRSMRDGRELVGWGVATGVWEALQVPIAVRVGLSADGRADVACAATDIGTGTYTIVAQVASDMLGVPIENIVVKLGDSTLPQSPVEGGSWIAASISNGIVTTCNAVRGELLDLARNMPNSPLAATTLNDVALVDGRLVSRLDASRAVPIADAMRHGAIDRIQHEKVTTFADDGSHARNTHSAIFAEVRVDEQLGVVRVARIVSAVAAGRILNTKTASSQIMGGVVGGIGMALFEETLIDHRFGRIMNADIAEYHVPVNADVRDITVIFVDERDDIVNPLGVKGVGEIGIVGTAAAIANAIYHATGKRVRDLPITLDKLGR